MRATLLTLIALAAGACGLILVPAGVASAAESAISTIGLLEAQGFDVKVDRIGSAPLEDCVVTNVRNPRERTELVPVIGSRNRDRNRDFVPVIVDRTVTVSLDCSRR
jgi:hypothetical protein